MKTTKETKAPKAPKPPKAPTPPKAKKIPTENLYKIRRKLQALAERGIDGEKTVAAEKLARLENRYDFTQLEPGGANLFEGEFAPAPMGEALPLCEFAESERDVASFAKWAIENGTGISCQWKGEKLLAEVAPASLPKLLRIARTIQENFGLLWGYYVNAPGTKLADRGTFLLGLYDGMMSEERKAGQPLPSINHPKIKKSRARKNSVALAPGVALHPYSVGQDMGRKIRLCVSVNEIAGGFRQQIAA